MEKTESASTAAFRRTGFLTFLAVMDLLGAAILAAAALLFLLLERDYLWGSALLALAALHLAAFWGMLRLRRYGRITELILAWIWLLAIPAGTIISVIVLKYLHRPSVRLLFAEQPPDGLSAEQVDALNDLAKERSAPRIEAVLITGLAGVILFAVLMTEQLSAPGRSRQKRTMADVRSVATACEEYSVDNNSYPPARSIQDLVHYIQPLYIKTLPMEDGWGNELRYQAWKKDPAAKGPDSYLVASPGKDGKWDGKNWRSDPGGPTKRFDADIVFRDGRFIAWPEGPQQ